MIDTNIDLLLSKKQVIVIDTFSGAGGMSLGFENVGMAVAVSIDKSTVATSVHAKNFPKCKHILGDIRNKKFPSLINNYIKKLDNKYIIFHASVECTNFSKGKTEDKDIESRQLVFDLFPYIDTINPDVVTIENVAQFKKIGQLEDEQYDFNDLKEHFKMRNYHFKSCVLNAADYGAATSRRRLFIVASKSPDYNFPMPTHTPIKYSILGLDGYTTLREKLNIKLPFKSVFSTDFETKFLTRIETAIIRHKQTEWLCNPVFNNYYNSLDEPCPTIISGGWLMYIIKIVKEPPSNDYNTKHKLHKYCVSKQIDIQYRQLSIEEQANIMGFPKTFDFLDLSNKDRKFLIGNAVEVKTATAIAKSLLKILK
jgi:DNA-cytosine methyltransferase